MPTIYSILFVSICFIHSVSAQSKYIDSLIRLDQLNVYFETASSDLDSVAMADLEALYAQSVEQKCDSIYINAHTDNVGEVNSNMALSLQRAEAVKNYLVQLGMIDQQIKIEEFGESQPIASNETERGRGLNRRSAVETYKKMRLTALSGYLLDAATGEGVQGEVYIGSSSIDNQLIANEDGFFETKVPVGSVLKIRRKALGYAVPKDTLFRPKPPTNIKLKLYVKPIQKVATYMFQGQLVDSLSGHPLQGEVVWEIQNEKQNLQVGEEGSFELLLPKQQKIKLAILVKDYLPITVYPSTTDSAVNIIKLSPLRKGATIAFKDLNFVGDRAILLESSYPELKRILQFLQLNESIRIEIAGHVDDTYGPPAEEGSFNHRLSEARAKAIYDYLTDNGINKKRMEHKGYANWDPAYPSPKSIEENLANRRVEIKILGDQ